MTFRLVTFLLIQEEQVTSEMEDRKINNTDRMEGMENNI